MSAAEPAKAKPVKGSGRGKRLTIYDVVRLTGFSRGSVSRAFNDSPFINPLTKEKILRVAKEIGYQPHAGARLIKAGRTRRWGILLPNFSNPYYANLFEAFDGEARRHETFLQLGLFHHEPKEAEALVTYWSAGEVDGLIADADAHTPAMIAHLKQTGFPVIFVHSRPSEEFDQLVFDRAEGIQHALQTLHMLGHRRVAYVGMAHAGQRHAAAYEAWKAWTETNGIADPEALCCFVANNSDGGCEAWRELRARSIRFTAVLAYNDIIACGLMQAARADQFRIPEDLSVIGNDDIDEGRRLGLTTMRHDLRLGAMLALKQLEARRQGDTSPPTIVRAESQFIMRDSVGPAPTGTL